MRKFTKEITALLASAAIGAAACSATVSASEQPVLPDEPAASSEENPPAAGSNMETDHLDEYDFPPTAGVPLPGDENIDELYDEYFSSFATAGIALLPDGCIEPRDDINMDRISDRTDMEILQKWLLHDSDESDLSECIQYTDYNYDGVVNAVDLTLLKQQALSGQESAKIKAENGITVFSNAPSTSGVADFLKTMKIQNGGYHYCYNLTPFTITKQYGFRIFDDDDYKKGQYDIYLEYDGEIYMLDRNKSHLSPMSFAIADLNQDGHIEIYYTYGDILGKKYTSPTDIKAIVCFDTASRNTREINYDADVLMELSSTYLFLRLTVQNGVLKIAPDYPIYDYTSDASLGLRTLTYLHPIGKLYADDEKTGIEFYPEYDKMYHNILPDEYN